jgi:hypothetical protein
VLTVDQGTDSTEGASGVATVGGAGEVDSLRSCVVPREGVHERSGDTILVIATVARHATARGVAVNGQVWREEHRHLLAPSASASSGDGDGHFPDTDDAQSRLAQCARHAGR